MKLPDVFGKCRHSDAHIVFSEPFLRMCELRLTFGWLALERSLQKEGMRGERPARLVWQYFSNEEGEGREVLMLPGVPGDSNTLKEIGRYMRGKTTESANFNRKRLFRLVCPKNAGLEGCKMLAWGRGAEDSTVQYRIEWVEGAIDHGDVRRVRDW